MQDPDWTRDGAEVTTRGRVGHYIKCFGGEAEGRGGVTRGACWEPQLPLERESMTLGVIKERESRERENRERQNRERENREREKIERENLSVLRVLVQPTCAYQGSPMSETGIERDGVGERTAEVL